MTLKEKIHSALLQTISDKINRLQQNLADLRMSASNETKSTAGDKYETALAILQTEQDNTNKQLQEQMRMRSVAENLDPQSSHQVIAAGSFVETDKGLFYISVAAGKLAVADKIVISISVSSPLGKKLCGLKKDDEADMNGIVYRVKSIV